MGNLYNLAMNVFKVGSDYYLLEPNKDYVFESIYNDKVNKSVFYGNKYRELNFVDFIIFLDKENRPHRIDLNISKYTDGYEYNYIYEGDRDRETINKELIRYAKKVAWLKVTKTDYEEYKDSENHYLKKKHNYIVNIKKKKTLKSYYVKLYESIVKDFFLLDEVKHNQNYEIICDGLEDYYFINGYFSIHLTKLGNMKININSLKLSGAGDFNIFKHLTRFINNLIENNVYNYNVGNKEVYRPEKKSYLEKYMLKQEYIESFGISYKEYCKERDIIFYGKLI